GRRDDQARDRDPAELQQSGREQQQEADRHDERPHALAGQMGERDRASVGDSDYQRPAPALGPVVESARGTRDILIVVLDRLQRRLIPQRMAASYYRNRGELGVHRRRLLGPFERVALPRVRPGLAPAPEAQAEVDEREQYAEAEYEGAGGGHEIVPLEPQPGRIGVHAPRHSLETGPVHGPERKVEPDEHQSQAPEAE